MMMPVAEDDLAHMIEGPHAYAALDGNRVEAIGGVHLFGHGRGEAWFLPGRGKISLKTHGFARMFCEYVIGSEQLTRLHAFVKVDFTAALRYGRFARFKVEAGPLRGFGPDGGDYLVMVHEAADGIIHGAQRRPTEAEGAARAAAGIGQAGPAAA